MESGAEWTLPVASEGINRTIYFFEGDQIKINNKLISQEIQLRFLPNKKITIIKWTGRWPILNASGKTHQ